MRGKLIFCFYSLHPIEQTKEGLIENSGDDVQADDENEHIKLYTIITNQMFPSKASLSFEFLFKVVLGKGKNKDRRLD